MSKIQWFNKAFKRATQKTLCVRLSQFSKIIREQTGWAFSDNLAHKYCKQAVIRSTARKTYCYSKGKENVKFPNKIFTDWNAKRQMEIVVPDMTVINSKKQGEVELTCILDTYIIMKLLDLLFQNYKEIQYHTLIV